MRVSNSVPLCVALLASVAASVVNYNVEWTKPTIEPGKTQSGASTYQGAMPLGNGALTALAWPNVTSGGVGLYIGHQNAMSSWTELFKLGLVQIVLSPNPFSSGVYAQYLCVCVCLFRLHQFCMRLCVYVSFASVLHACLCRLVF